jgi:hypothetical protein
MRADGSSESAAARGAARSSQRGAGVVRDARRASLAAREIGLAALAALALAALAIGGVLFDSGRVYFALDTGSSQLPWSAHVPQTEEARPRNGELSDQGMVFHPHYKWVSASWRAGDPPLWNPLLYAGVPGLGNPQAGVLDPQVLLLVALEHWGGERALLRGYALLAWLRLACAGLGAYLLARALGSSRAAGLLAGSAFGLSGYLVLWLNYSLGHVPPFLPWILLGLEGTRGRRPWICAAGAACALALAVLGGHPETAFYVGAASGLWALAILREDARAGARALLALALGSLLSAPSLLPFLEYLKLSAAQAVRAAQHASPAQDWLALGLLLIGVALVLAWRRSQSWSEIHLGGHGDAGHEHAGHEHAAPARAAWRAPVGLACALCGIYLLLRARGLPRAAELVLAHDLYGAPDAGGFRGTGSYVESASGWLPLVVLAFAGAGLLALEGRLRRRGLIAALGAAALLLCVQAPGLLELYRHVPLVGLGATVRLGAVSSLMLALLAADALDAAPRAARRAAALALLVLLASLALPRPSASLPAELPRGPAQDELVVFTSYPAERVRGGGAPIAGWVHPALDFDAAQLRIERLGASGEPSGEVWRLPCDLSQAAFSGAPSAPGSAPAPQGARHFFASQLQWNRLAPGAWRFTLELVRTRKSESEVEGEAQTLGERLARVCVLELEPAWSLGSSAAAGAALLALLAPPGPALGAAAALASCAHGLWFAHGMNPSVPVAEAFPPTRAEAIAARELGDGRLFADAGVFPPSTTLVRGLRALGGYDGMDVASFNELRRYALKPGAHALLAFGPRHAALESPVLRLLGVELLATDGPFAHPDWELIAGPTAQAPEYAEVHLHRARAPLPRAFLVPRVASLEDVRSQIAAGGFDPLALASAAPLEPLARPYAQGAIEALEFDGNNRVRMRARLDGDGFLVLTEQHFPGWRATVGGREQPIAYADGIFRGLYLAAGEHEIVFEYAPRSLRIGLALAASALLALLALVALELSTRARHGLPELG